MKRSDRIRVGDLVKIVDPQIFVRCGYPLCISDVAAKIEPAAIIEFLSRSSAGTPEEISRIITHHPHHRLQRAYQEAARAGALAVMIANGFGGSERRIYTKEMPEMRGCIVRVEGKRRVVTGHRYSGCGPGYYGDEAEWPSLENQQHHTLISFDPYYGGTELSLAMLVAATDKPYEIEQRFVEKAVLTAGEVEE